MSNETISYHDPGDENDNPEMTMEIAAELEPDDFGEEEKENDEKE